MKIEDGFEIASYQPYALCHFSECPKAITLLRHVTLEDTSRAYCWIDLDRNEDIKIPQMLEKFKAAKVINKKRKAENLSMVDDEKVELEIFIPQQKLIARLNNRRFRFFFLKISINREDVEPTHWLVTDPISRKGLLFAIAMFDEEGRGESCETTATTEV